MPVTRLNHAVLYVRDLEVTREFYEGALGFETLTHLPGQAAFLRAPGLDERPRPRRVPDRLGRRARARPVAAPSGCTTWPGRWTRSTSSAGCATCSPSGARWSGASDHVTTKSLYAHDPDGLEFEVCWVLPASVLTPEIVDDARAGPRPRPLDLEAEKARFGAQTRGGVGISIPEPAS